MKERPILFSAPMVNAILADIKTQTRRTNKLEKINHDPDTYKFEGFTNWAGEHCATFCNKNSPTPWLIKPSLGTEGDQLYVRETLSAIANWGLYYAATDVNEQECLTDKHGDKAFALLDKYGDHYDTTNEVKIPSIHMPRWASRIDLHITNVRVERLQNISESDALAEGIIKIYSGVTNADIYAHYGAISKNAANGNILIDIKFAAPTAKAAFEKLWVSINGQKSWDDNPWVWVIDFERIRP